MKNNLMTISFSKSSSSDLEYVSSPQQQLTTNEITKDFPITIPPSKKSRGRPRGSKNKPTIWPKPYYVSIGQPSDSPQKPIIVNVPPGGDVIKYIVDVARRGHISVVILSVTGSVASVTLCHTLLGGPAIVLYGPFTLISLNGSYIYDNNNEYTPLHSGATFPSNLSFGISLCSSEGQVFGGVVSNKVIASTDGIQVVLSAFKNSFIYKHILEREETDNNNNTYSNTHSKSNFSGAANQLSVYNIIHCENL